jgi:DNA primase
MKRYIPPQTHHKIYYAPKFKAWTNTMIPDKMDDKYEEDRIIFPLIDRNGKMFGYQGRALNKNEELKYITIMLEEHAKIYGLDTVDLSKKIPVFEGPIDSLFIENSLASCGGKVTSNLELLNTPKENFIVVYDNEPRSKHTIKKIEQTIEDGFNVCIWPDEVKQKDINDMILKGKLTAPDIKKIIEANTFRGLTATLRLNEWKKI